MNKLKWTFALALAASALALATPAEAQSCNDRWVTQAIREVYVRAPNGSGNSGECDTNRYGGAQWTSYAQLKYYVNFQYVCTDPWVGMAVFDALGRLPRGSGSNGECSRYIYGDNWRGDASGYRDLKTRVRGVINALDAVGIVYNNSGNLVIAGVTQPAGGVKFITPAGLVAAGAGNLIGSDGATLIGSDGASIIGNAGGNLVGNAGNTLVGKKYGLQSTSRKIQLPGGSTLIIP